jgi:hypothetical protein
MVSALPSASRYLVPKRALGLLAISALAMLAIAIPSHGIVGGTGAFCDIAEGAFVGALFLGQVEAAAPLGVAILFSCPL